MNKKFSTLMAVFLAAGATFTAEAGVVKVTTPVKGKQYVIAGKDDATNGKFVKSVYYVALDGTNVVGNTIAANTETLSNLTAWTLDWAGDVANKGYSVKVGTKSLKLNSTGNGWVYDETTPGDLGDAAFYLASDKLGVKDGQASLGDNGASIDKCLVNPAIAGSAFTAAASGSASEFAFYANAYSAGDKNTDGYEIMTGIAENNYVFIQIGGKYVSVDAAGTGIEMVDATALKTTLGKYRATFKVLSGNVTFEAIAATSANKNLTVTTNALALINTTGKAFYYDLSDAYIAEKGASLYSDDAMAKYINEEGTEVTSSLPNVSLRAEVKILKSSQIVMATNTAAQGMERSLVYAEDFVNGGSYYLSNGGANFVTIDAEGALTAPTTPTLNSLWKVVETKDNAGTYSYTFYNEATKQYLKVGAVATFTSGIADQGYTGGIVLASGEKALQAASSAANAPTLETLTAAANQIYGFYRPANTPYTVSELKAFQNGSFSMTIATDKDHIGKYTIKDADVFGGSLIPVGATDDATRFRLTDADGKYIVLDTKTAWGVGALDGTANKGLRFKKVAAADLAKTEYLSYFEIAWPQINGKAGNEEFVVNVYESSGAASSSGRLFIAKVADNYYLTVAQSLGTGEMFAYVKNGGSDLVNLKTFLLKGKFYTVARVDAEYQIEKVLGTASNGAAALLDKGAVQMDQPEGQWAASVDANGKLVLTNRESLAKYTDLGVLYGTDKDNIYKNGDKLYQIKVVEKHAATDGYEAWTNNQLRDEQYTLGFYSNVLGAAAYMSENHENKHLIGLEKDIKNATAWDVKAFDAKRTDDARTDSVYVISNLYFWNKDKKGGADWDIVSDTLKTVSYTFTNASNGEPVKYNATETAYICDPTADVKGDRFAIKKMADGKYNLVAVSTNDADEDADKYYTLASNKLYGGFSVAQGNVNATGMYDKSENDLAVIEKTAAPEYVKRSMGDTIRIFREGAESSILFEKGEFLGLENIHEFTKMAPAMYVDTAYYNRGTNNRWQYLLGVEIDRKVVNDDCGVPSHAKFHADTTYGRFLVNLVDSAELYKKTHLHDNKYVNTEGFAKLGFVKGFHTNDTLVIQRNGVLIPAKADSIYMGSKDFNVAKFAFRIVDHETNAFKIETLYKKFSDGPAAKADKLGYLKWMNGFVVVVNDINNGDTFNLEADHSAPTANEGVNASEVAVIAKEGAVVINGAAGKKVTISNVLGQTIANTVTSSDNATINVPAGVVIVAVEGEAAVKAIVK